MQTLSWRLLPSFQSPELPHNGKREPAWLSMRVTFYFAACVYHLPLPFGLELIHRAADWAFLQFNRDPSGIEEFLQENHHAGSTSVPVRQNRALLFDSMLFHQSDPFRFKEGTERATLEWVGIQGRARLVSDACCCQCGVDRIIGLILTDRFIYQGFCNRCSWLEWFVALRLHRSIALMVNMFLNIVSLLTTFSVASTVRYWKSLLAATFRSLGFGSQLHWPLDPALCCIRHIGFENRRLNLTFLFGRRGQPPAAGASESDAARKYPPEMREVVREEGGQLRYCL